MSIARRPYTSYLTVKVTLPANSVAYRSWFPTKILIPEIGSEVDEFPVTRPVMVLDAAATSTSPVDYIFQILYDKVNLITISKNTINQLQYSTTGAKPRAFDPFILTPYKTMQVRVTNVANVGASDVTHSFNLEVRYL